MNKPIRMSGGIIDSRFSDIKKPLQEFVNSYHRLIDGSDDDYSLLMETHFMVCGWYLELYSEAERIEKLTIKHENKIAKLTQQLNNQPVIHRKNHAVRRNLLARFWSWVTLRK